MKRIALTLAWLMVPIMLAQAAAPPPPPDLLARASMDQRLGAQLPMRVRFMDLSGRFAPLSEWVDGRPTIIMLGYFRCPNLCGVLQQAMAHALDGAGLHPDVDVSVIFLSIDPHETLADAEQARQQLRHHADAWHFLTGDDASIRAVVNAIGYRYDYDAGLQQYAHPAGAVVVDANGVVSQYLPGVTFMPQTMRLAIVAASHHTIGNVVDRLVLLCCGYDPTTGRYTLSILRMMQWLGIAFLGLLPVLFLWFRYGRRSLAR